MLLVSVVDVPPLHRYNYDGDTEETPGLLTISSSSDEEPADCFLPHSPPACHEHQEGNGD